ncbi:MAG: hypothetical protein ABIL09_18345 [Gemmatimonadota bacterium]
MHRLYNLKTKWALVLYAVFDVLGVGLGMGVPIVCIALGLPAGWVVARRAAGHADTREQLARSLRGAALVAGITFVLMAGFWGPWFVLLLDPAADLARLGMPLLLYEPTASFVGWLVLMIFISPFLQFLMAVLGVHLAILWGPSGANGPTDS